MTNITQKFNTFSLGMCEDTINSNTGRGCGRFKFKTPLGEKELKLLYVTFPSILFFAKEKGPLHCVTWMTPEYLEYKQKS